LSIDPGFSFHNKIHTFFKVHISILSFELSVQRTTYCRTTVSGFINFRTTHNLLTHHVFLVRWTKRSVERVFISYKTPYPIPQTRSFIKSRFLEHLLCLRLFELSSSKRLVLTDQASLFDRLKCTCRFTVNGSRFTSFELSMDEACHWQALDDERYFSLGVSSFWYFSVLVI
jgi:hypothetical protein